MTVTSAGSGESSICARQRPRRGGVTLADVGGEDQDALRPVAGGPAATVGFAVAASHDAVELRPLRASGPACGRRHAAGTPPAGAS